MSRSNFPPLKLSKVSAAMRKRQLVACHCLVPSALQGAGTSGFTRQEVRWLVKSCDQPSTGWQAHMPNFYVGAYPSTGGEQPGANAITVQGGYEHSIVAGVLVKNYKMRFNGADTGIVNPGHILASDPGGFWVPGATYIRPRTGVSVGTGGKWPAQRIPQSSESGFDSQAVVTQVYGIGNMTNPGGGTATGSVAETLNGFMPLAISGIVKFPTIAAFVWGTSIENGALEGAGGDGLGNYGAMKRAFAAANIPAFFATRDQGQVQYIGLNQGSGYLELEMMKYCNVGIYGAPTNDMATSANRTSSDAFTDLQNLWTAGKINGLYNIQLLLLPRVTGTFATLAGQTPLAGWETGGNERDDLHNRIFAAKGQGLLDDVWDFRSVFADPVQQDKWKVNITPDGVHPDGPTHINLWYPPLLTKLQDLKKRDWY